MTVPYKTGIGGKHKITGDLARWVATFRAYFTADFPPGTFPQGPRVPFEAYLAAMTGMLALRCEDLLPGGAARNELLARHSVMQDATASGEHSDHYRDMTLYKVLEWIIEIVPAEELSKQAVYLRQFLIDRKEKIFLE